MVIVINTREHYLRLRAKPEFYTSSLWVSHDILAESEVIDARQVGVDLTLILKSVNFTEDAAVNLLLADIRVLHPDQPITLLT
ncbi:MAG: hypothetical protein VX185_16440 [Pseudomonadota bacterium]|nr:hypothetical protein [Pseudomonadota bacterium]